MTGGSTTPPRKVCVVSGGRADYGLLQPVMAELRAAPALALQLAVSGMHLDPAFGATASEIAAEGFAIDAAVDLPLSEDGPAALARATGAATAGFGEAFARLRPDLVLVLGDRWEILGAAAAALLARLPLAHLCGGDVTEGAYDDAIRHAVTKMASLHFPSNAPAARRLTQLGEPADRVHLVGSTGIDRLRTIPTMSRAEVERETALDLGRPTLLVTYHPATAGEDPARGIDALLAALDGLGAGVTLAFTLPGADAGRGVVVARIDAFVAGRANARCFRALGSPLYGNLLRLSHAVVGNSSSGLYEAPFFGTPTVDVGDRQQGRLKAASVFSCPPERDAIAAAIAAALARGRRPTPNPYDPFGDGRAARRIVEVLAAIPDFSALLRKPFAPAPG